MKIKLLVLLLLSCLTTGVGAKTVREGDICYYLNDNDKTATVVDLAFYYQANLKIPSGFSYSENSYSYTTYYTVTGIGSSAFKNKIWLETVAIPKTVTDIGEDVFFGCSKLTCITVDPDNTKYTSIDGILYDKDITKIICYPSDKAGSSFTIPASVASIESSALASCLNLEAINVTPDNTVYASIDGVLYDKGVTNLFCYPCSKTEPTLTIPSSVTGIRYYAFDGCKNLSSVTIPDGVVSLDYAFYGCHSLTSITIPNGVTSIGQSAFEDCI